MNAVDTSYSDKVSCRHQLNLSMDDPFDDDGHQSVCFGGRRVNKGLNCIHCGAINPESGCGAPDMESFLDRVTVGGGLTLKKLIIPKIRKQAIQAEAAEKKKQPKALNFGAEDHAKMLILSRRGWTNVAIAKHFGCDRGYVSEHLGES